MRLRHILILLLLICIPIKSALYGQEALHDNLDSLYKELRKPENNESKKMQLFTDIGRTYLNLNPDSASAYLHNARVLSKKLGDKPNEQLVYTLMTSLHDKNFDSSYHYIIQTISASKLSGDSLQLGQSYYDIAIVLLNGINTTGRENELTINKNVITFLDSAIEVYQNLNVTIKLVDCLARKAETLMYLQKMDEAGHIFNKAIDLHRQSTLQDKEFIPLFLMYGEYLFKNAQYDSALIYHQKAVQIVEESKMNARLLVYGLSMMAQDYGKLGKFDIAIHSAERGLQIAREHDLTKEYIDATNALYRVYKEKKDFKSALKYHEILFHVTDSLNAKQMQESVTSFNLQLEFDKKSAREKAEQEKKFALAEKELQRQKMIRNGSIVGFLLMLAFSGTFLHQRNRIKKGNVALNRAKERAEQSEQFKQQFLANMSHEIRTPMNAVSGMTQLLLDKEHLPNQLKYLLAIQNSSDSLLHIINDILDLSKVEAGKLELEEIDFSLSEVVQQVMETLRIKSEEKGLQFITSVDKQLEDIVLGDPYRLKQILINLCGNAIKFTNTGSVELRIEPGKSGETVFRVIDTGIGIPADKLDSVFESFQQAQASDTRRYGGTGLGLSISKQLIELQGGHISLTSIEGSGTEFIFELPLPPGSKDRYERQSVAGNIMDATALNGLSILLADDNEYNRIVASETILSKADVVIDHALNGREVIEMLRNGQYDLILMDVQMPIMSGLEATRMIREQFEEPMKSIPIIALTASVLRSDLDQCWEAGMTAYVPKPFKSIQLIQAIAKVVDRDIQIADRPVTNSAKAYDQDTVTDLTFLKSFTEGDDAIMQKYIDIYIQKTRIHLDKLSEAMDASDHTAIGSMVHTMKGQCKMMGMRASYDLCVKIEHAIETGDLGSIRSSLEEFMALCQKAITELQKR